MKRESGIRLKSFIMRKKRGMALPLTLIVLLVAGAMVAVSLFLIENMTITTKMKTDDELRMNAALAGVEIGKELLIKSISEENYLPRRENFSLPVSSKDIDTADSVFSFLVARDKNNKPLRWTGTLKENLSVDVLVYDMAFEPETGVKFVAGMPPRMRDVWDPSDREGQSIIQGQSYASSNRGGGSGSVGTSGFEDGFYLVRSTALLNNVGKTVEQAIRLNP